MSKNACPPLQTRCGGACVNLLTAKHHCGECGLVCAGTATCQNGICVAGGAYREVRRFGASDLNQPFGITVDRQGVLYVTDDFPDRIVKLTGDGDVITSWPTVGANPTGIEITPAGELYACNFDSNNVQTYSNNGTAEHSFPTAERPSGLAIGPGGVVYVVPFSEAAVQIFNLAGDLIGRWSGFQYGFNRPTRVAAAPNGDVYVTNHGSQDVVWVSAAGEVQGRWGGNGPGWISFPHGVTVDAAGFVYVADRGNYRVQKYTASGDFVGAFGDFARPDVIIDVAVSRTGMVYVTLPLNDHVIVQFEPD